MDEDTCTAHEHENGNPGASDMQVGMSKFIFHLNIQIDTFQPEDHLTHILKTNCHSIMITSCNFNFM